MINTLLLNVSIFTYLMVKKSEIKKNIFLYVRPLCGICDIKFSLYLQYAACKIIGSLAMRKKWIRLLFESNVFTSFFLFKLRGNFKFELEGFVFLNLYII